MNESRILTDRFIDPDCSPCSCFGKLIEQVHLAASLATVGWQCSACGHRWPTDWARARSLNVREKARAFQDRQQGQERGR